MNKLLALTALVAMLPACLIYTDSTPSGDYYDPGPDVVIDYNAAPQMLDAQAGCFWDRRLQDDVWYFDATADDADGPYDIVEMWADVYDDITGELIESFELVPTEDPYLWSVEYMASSVYIDCWYPWYSVDFVAIDAYEAWDSLLVYPETY